MKPNSPLIFTENFSRGGIISTLLEGRQIASTGPRLPAGRAGAGRGAPRLIGLGKEKNFPF